MFLLLLFFFLFLCFIDLNRQLYGDIKDVVVPKMYLEETTSKVLVMEWVEVNFLCVQLYSRISFMFNVDCQITI